MSNGIIKGCRVHHIAISATDFQKSVDFYMNGLGFKPTINWGKNGDLAQMLDIGSGSCLEIFSDGKKADHVEGSWRHLALGVDDCDAAFAAAVAAGAAVRSEPTDVDIQSNPVAKVRIAFVYGPDGEVIEFFQNR